MFHGTLFDQRLGYWFAIVNGNGENKASDDDDDKDFIGRVEVTPLPLLTLGVGYRYTPPNRKNLTGPGDVKTVGNQITTFLDYAAGNRMFGHRDRGTIDAKVLLGPCMVSAEGMFDANQDVVSPKGARQDLLDWGWSVDASALLTGEDEADVIEPLSPFWGEHGLGHGAFEVGLRYEEFQADRATLRDGFAAGARVARSTTACLTWIPVKRVRLMLSYTYTNFDRTVRLAGVDDHDDHVIVGRLALFF
jgi:hypothetical protein